MNKAKLLLVDDQRQNLIALGAILEELDAEILTAESGNEALGLLLEHEFALVLLDVQMPEMDGFETASIMRSREKTMHTPIIFVTAISKEQKYIFAGYEKGAVDYLFKPLDETILRSKVRVFLDLYAQRKSLEKAYFDLRMTSDELRQLNEKIVEDQKSLIEEERLRILLQLTGVTALEMNHPLNIILEGLDILKLRAIDYPDLSSEIERIREAGVALSGIIDRIKDIPLVEMKSIDGKSPDSVKNSINILCVDDDLNYYRLMSFMLKDKSFINLFHSKTCETTEKLLLEKQTHFDLILLDHELRDGDSGRILLFLRQNQIDIPVIVITGEGDEIIAARALKLGAADYYPKMDLKKDILFDAVISTIEQHRLKHELKTAMTKVVEMATKDSLTGLYNRRFFLDNLELEINRSQRYQGDITVCLMDVDHFKTINDSYGHAAGDQVLKEIARIMNDTMRGTDILCRYGGDEFAIIFSHTSERNAFGICERFRQAVEDDVCLCHHQNVHVTVSIGLSSYDCINGPSVANFLEDADKQLYLAKEKGRNRVCCASSDLIPFAT